MAFAKGQSGNPRGRPPAHQPFKLALREALNQTHRDTRRKHLQMVAESLVEQAICGDVAAIKEIAERMDGKVAQVNEHTGKNGGPVLLIFSGVPDAAA